MHIKLPRVSFRAITGFVVITLIVFMGVGTTVAETTAPASIPVLPTTVVTQDVSFVKNGLDAWSGVNPSFNRRLLTIDIDDSVSEKEGSDSTISLEYGAGIQADWTIDGIYQLQGPKEILGVTWEPKAVFEIPEPESYYPGDIIEIQTSLKDEARVASAPVTNSEFRIANDWSIAMDASLDSCWFGECTDDSIYDFEESGSFDTLYVDQDEVRVFDGSDGMAAYQGSKTGHEFSYLEYISWGLKGFIGMPHSQPTNIFQDVSSASVPECDENATTFLAYANCSQSAESVESMIGLMPDEYETSMNGLDLDQFIPDNQSAPGSLFMLMCAELTKFTPLRVANAATMPGPLRSKLSDYGVDLNFSFTALKFPLCMSGQQVQELDVDTAIWADMDLPASMDYKVTRGGVTISSGNGTVVPFIPGDRIQLTIPTSSTQPADMGTTIQSTADVSHKVTHNFSEAVSELALKLDVEVPGFSLCEDLDLGLDICDIGIPGGTIEEVWVAGFHVGDTCSNPLLSLEDCEDGIPASRILSFDGIDATFGPVVDEQLIKFSQEEVLLEYELTTTLPTWSGTGVIFDPENHPVPVAGGPYVSNEGTPIAFDASGSYDLDYNDTLEYRWDFDNDGVWDTSRSTNPVSAHTWGDDHSGAAKVEVFDGKTSRTDTTSVTVNNVAPSTSIDSMTQPNEHFILPAVHELRFDGSFTDPGWLDSHTVEWDFGDGTTSAGTMSEENDAPDATGSTSVTHTYYAPGDYTVTMTVSDDDGGSHASTYQVHVATAYEAIGILRAYMSALPSSSFNGDAGQRKMFFDRLLGVAQNISLNNNSGPAHILDIPIQDRIVGGSPRGNNVWMTNAYAADYCNQMIDDIVALLTLSGEGHS